MAASNPSKIDAVMQRPPAPIELIDLKAQQRLLRDRIDRAVARVLDHGQYIMGPEVRELEAKLAAFSGARHCLGCASGTDALLIAMMALGVGRGDAVLCPAFTYTATPETIALLGASPVFVDVDPDTFNVSPKAIAGGLDAARRANLRPVGLIAVDLFGQPADYPALDDIAQGAGLWLLADAAQSFGASLGGKRVGTFGRIAATSFFPAKPLGCYGDGGAIFTGDAGLAAVMDSIRLHGKAIGGDKYDIERIGVNGRLDTIQAAVLIEKLSVFEDELLRRQAIAERYTRELADVCTVPNIAEGAKSAWAQYTIRVPRNIRSRLTVELKAAGVPTAIYYPRPLHHQKAYRDFPVATGGLPVSEQLAEEVVSLPMHPYLEPASQVYIITMVRATLRGAT